METTNQPAVQQEDKTAAILAYITLIGFIIAIVMHSSNKTKLGAYHLRLALALLICAVGLWFVTLIMMFIPFVNVLFIFLSPFIWLGVLVFVIMGIINASGGQEKPLPLIGGIADKFFPTAFA
jgi:uncharacterized membrane protein